MFTGVIRAKSSVVKAVTKNRSLLLTIKKPGGWRLKAGDSVATNGVCLTVKKLKGSSYETELMPETLAISTFGKTIPKLVNLERPLTLQSFLDGHVVLGHVDAVGQIKKITNRGQSKDFTISFPKKYQKLLVNKGSVTVDGVGLTCFAVKNNEFTVSLVSYTLTHTTLGQNKIGDKVNLEFDIVAKYLQRLNSKSK